MHVVDFYNRGGDFPNPDLDDNIHRLGLTEQDEKALVAFLIGLTDERVAYERAPFDHPSICMANGQVGNSSRVKIDTSGDLPGGGTAVYGVDDRLCVPAVGATGSSQRLQPYLKADMYRH